MEKNAIGIVELSSIASGYMVSDAMLKAANVDLLVARTICSGKYLSVIGGDVADVTTAVEVGRETAGVSCIDTSVLSNIHPSVFPAIAGTHHVEARAALGVIESFSVASLIEAADAAIKAADIELIEIRLAMALGGKAFVTLTGEVSAVQSAVDVGAEVVSNRGLLVNTAVIPAPRGEIMGEIV